MKKIASVLVAHNNEKKLDWGLIAVKRGGLLCWPVRLGGRSEIISCLLRSPFICRPTNRLQFNTNRKRGKRLAHSPSTSIKHFFQVLLSNFSEGKIIQSSNKLCFLYYVQVWSFVFTIQVDCSVISFSIKVNLIWNHTQETQNNDNEDSKELVAPISFPASSR